MNHQAVGLGSWLLRDAVRQGTISLDTQSPLLDWQSFALWQAEQGKHVDAMQAAMQALFRELWQDKLTASERAVLWGLHIEGKSEAELARSLRLHHSTVSRLRRRGEENLKGGLGYVMRYRSLVETAQEQMGG